MAKTVKVTYKGGMDEVRVLFPSGDARTFQRGGSADVLPTDAATLSRDDWDGTGVGVAFDPPEEQPTPTPAPEEE